MSLLSRIAKILHAKNLDTRLIFRVKVFPYDLPVSHGTPVTHRHTYTQTDRQTHRAIDAYSMVVTRIK